MKANFEKKRAAIREEQAQAASQAATKQKNAAKKKEGSPIWHDSDSAECEPRVGSMMIMTFSARRKSDRMPQAKHWHSDSAECEPTGLAACYALISAESEAKHSDSDDYSDGSTD